MKITEKQLKAALGVLSGRVDMDNTFWRHDVVDLYQNPKEELWDGHADKYSVWFKAESILFELLKCKL